MACEAVPQKAASLFLYMEKLTESQMASAIHETRCQAMETDG